MPLKTLLVLPTNDVIWVRRTELPFPPFPGLGIRVDVYEMLDVVNVVVGDFGYDVTCIVRLGDTPPGEATDKKCRALGFEVGGYP